MPIQQLLGTYGGTVAASYSALLHFNGADGSTTFTDQSGKTWTAVANAQIDTAQSKFGGASGLFDGALDRITTPNHVDFNFGTGDFTVEWFQRWNSSASYQILFDYGYAGANAITLQSRGGGNEAKWECFINGSSAGFESTAATLSTWYHYAVVREGTTVRIYRDGVQTASGTSSASIAPATVPFVIGAKGSDGSQGFNGWVDEFRVTKGTCIYPGGTTFTPPSSPFPD